MEEDVKDQITNQSNNFYEIYHTLYTKKRVGNNFIIIGTYVIITIGKRIINNNNR